jgi:hypothetical protein
MEEARRHAMAPSNAASKSYRDTVKNANVAASPGTPVKGVWDLVNMATLSEKTWQPLRDRHTAINAHRHTHFLTSGWPPAAPSCPAASTCTAGSCRKNRADELIHSGSYSLNKNGRLSTSRDHCRPVSAAARQTHCHQRAQAHTLSYLRLAASRTLLPRCLHLHRRQLQEEQGGRVNTQRQLQQKHERAI